MTDLPDVQCSHFAKRLIRVRHALARGRKLLARQRHIVQKLAGDGKILALAKELLQHLEGMQEARLAERDVLRTQIAKFKDRELDEGSR